MRNLLAGYFIIILFISCEKNAGQGGTSSIEGKVIYFTTSYNTQNQLNDTHYFPKAGKDIYIIYSDDENAIYDDDFETDWEGRYHFENLRKGNYTVFTYVDSIVVNNITYDYPIFKHIKIEENNSSNLISDFLIQQ
ncbi:MAG: hypothetical protein VX347_01895 [Bacteroidota bacterium]|nr:hypothetical protein [Bacteroidota bacterium]